MTQQQDSSRWFNIVKTIDKLQTDHFELFDTQHEEIEKAVEKLGYKGKGSENWSLYDAFAHCGSAGYYKKLEDGRIIRIRISVFSNICEYCHKQSDDTAR